MKQHITTDQWKEISEKQRDIMRDGWIFNHPLEVFSLPTIGQMIEYLVENERPTADFFISKVGQWEFEGDHGDFWRSERSTGNHEELADALWTACKAVLNQS